MMLCDMNACDAFSFSSFGQETSCDYRTVFLTGTYFTKLAHQQSPAQRPTTTAAKDSCRERGTQCHAMLNEDMINKLDPPDPPDELLLLATYTLKKASRHKWDSSTEESLHLCMSPSSDSDRCLKVLLRVSNIIRTTVCNCK